MFFGRGVENGRTLFAAVDGEDVGGVQNIKDEDNEENPNSSVSWSS